MKNPETHAALGIQHWGKIYKTKRKTKRLTPTTTKPGNETRVKRKKNTIKRKILTVNLTKHPEIESSCSSICFL
jgi:carbohydrate-binding DOMON domain-containing protein